jgi:hypothetical protein
MDGTDYFPFSPYNENCSSGVSISQVVSMYNESVEIILITVQKLLKYSDESKEHRKADEAEVKSFGQTDEVGPQDFSKLQSRGLELHYLASLQLQKLLKVLEKLIQSVESMQTDVKSEIHIREIQTDRASATLSKTCSSRILSVKLLGFSAILTKSILPLAKNMLGLYGTILHDLSCNYKSLGKLLYVCLRIFRTLLAKGLCSDRTKEGDAENEGNNIDRLVFPFLKILYLRRSQWNDFRR